MLGDFVIQFIKDIVVKIGVLLLGYQMCFIKVCYGDFDCLVFFQFWDYFVQLVYGDFGKFIEYYFVNVMIFINQVLLWILYLVIVLMIFGWIVGIWLGV